jgi:hypothetical protein
MITEKKSQITDISIFSYWLHQKGFGIYESIVISPVAQTYSWFPRYTWKNI